MRALLGKEDGDGLADAGAGSGDECCFVSESEHDRWRAEHHAAEAGFHSLNPAAPAIDPGADDLMNPRGKALE